MAQWLGTFFGAVIVQVLKHAGPELIDFVAAIVRKSFVTTYEEATRRPELKKALLTGIPDALRRHRP